MKASLIQQVNTLKQSAPEIDELKKEMARLLSAARARKYPKSLLNSISLEACGVDLESLLAKEEIKDHSVASTIVQNISSSNQNVSEEDASKAHFDPFFYLEANPDVKEAGIDPFIHYYHHGWAEHRDPNSEFNIASYLDNNPDIAIARIEPLGHYHAYGKHEGRRLQPKLKKTFGLFTDIDDREHCVVIASSKNYPPRRGDSSKAKRIKTPSVGIHIHVHYHDEIDYICRKLSMSAPFASLYISCTSQAAIEAVEQATKTYRLKPVSIQLVENRGRDLAPLLLVFAEKMLTHECCLHIHAKKSPEKRDDFGKAWTAHMLQCLLYDEDYTRSLLSFFLELEEVSILAPSIYEPIRIQMNWGKNEALVKSYLDKLDINSSAFTKCPHFPAGSFFWFKPRMLQSLLNLELELDSFPTEPIPDDGTIAHAIERLIGCIETAQNGYVLHARPLDTHIKIRGSVPLISIVIPLFNAAPWIYDCISSCICQDFIGPYEIIVVDNGSTDESSRMVSAFANIYPARIKRYDQPLKGAGNARNMGIQNARGSLITFVDADDALTPNALQTLWDAMKLDKDVDFAVASLSMFSETTFGRSVPYGKHGSVTLVEMENASRSNSIQWRTMIEDFGPCVKLYNANFLRSHNLQFPDTNYEDNFFISHVYALSQKAAVVASTLYLYRKYESREGLTQSTEKSLASLADQLSVLKATRDSFEQLVGVNSISVHRRNSVVDSLKRKTERLAADIQLNSLRETMNYQEMMNQISTIGQICKSSD